MQKTPIELKVIKTALLGVVAVLFIYAWYSGLLVNLLERLDSSRVSGWVQASGVWGPVVIIGLMTFAVVASPVPSAPIAIAAGAAYGHTIGTVFIVVGAFMGAMIAFGLARFLGRDAVSKWLGEKASKGMLGSQNALTLTVFFSRMLPFVSFDMISYAAGLSNIATWRFAIATLIGVVPTAFLMAHLGETAIESDSSFAIWFSVLLALVVALPLFVQYWRKG